MAGPVEHLICCGDNRQTRSTRIVNFGTVHGLTKAIEIERISGGKGGVDRLIWIAHPHEVTFPRLRGRGQKADQLLLEGARILGLIFKNPVNLSLPILL